MQNHTKREIILDTMQELMNGSSAQAISVSDIAQKAGIGKGSIYYYFSSKNDIIEAVIERSYSRAIEKARALAASGGMNAFQKLEIIFHACLESSSELKRQEQSATFNEMQQSALIHQRFIRILISRLKPILADIIRQGIGEGSICCDYPEETAQIVLIVLTVTLDNHLAPSSEGEIRRLLEAFAAMQEKSMGIDPHLLDFLTSRP